MRGVIYTGDEGLYKRSCWLRSSVNGEAVVEYVRSLFFLLAVAGFSFSTLACIGGAAEEFAEQSCSRQVECEILEEEDYDQCVSNLIRVNEDIEDDDECWDATNDYHGCREELSCDDYTEMDAVEQVCGDELEFLNQHCEEGPSR